ncbi:MAG: GNAT family N-acetyltransferase [Brevundimonas sp.]|uniref:GNAT family N-acetyltransferase n=1 Tax=Brevundimonas sp. TaxID=1871086 RepID=UPI00403443F9
MSHDIRPADLDHASVQALLDLHFRGMHANSPPGTAFVLDLSGLRHPDISVWTIWRDDEAVSVGALRRLAADHGEIKSMRTRPDMAGRGLGAAMLAHIIAEARRRGMSRLSLETGAGDAFEPALRLYRSRGFVDGPPFGDYQPGDFNQFLHLTL